MGTVSARETTLLLARDSLLARLHARSDDFAATKELQGVYADLATLRAATLTLPRREPFAERGWTS